MVHTDSSKGSKRKPRGRPFPRGNKRGKIEGDILAPTGSKGGDERNVIEKKVRPKKIGDLVPIETVSVTPIETMPIPEGPGVEFQLPPKALEALENAISDHLEKPPAPKELELIDSIEFRNGENLIEIKLFKKHNRMYRVQTFLNGNNEIRPVTYTGASMAFSYWELLKGSLK